MERKFEKDKELQNLYQSFMNEYIELGHMKLVDNTNITGQNSDAFYLPHNAVLKHVGDMKKNSDCVQWIY